MIVRLGRNSTSRLYLLGGSEVRRKGVRKSENGKVVFLPLVIIIQQI